MMVLVRTSLTLALFASAALSSTALSAQPRDSGTIVVSALSKPDFVADQRAVQFRDLAIDRRSGQTALLHRVGYAIESLCGNSIGSADPVKALKCSNTAWAGVKPQLDTLLKR